MTEYALYLESGPKMRKTQVHVLSLLGCTAQGLTTETALTAAPEAIRTFLRFLRRHGERTEPDAPFTTTVAAHVMEGNWLGNGDPTPGFAPDFEPLGADDLCLYLLRLGWMQEDLMLLVRNMTPEQLAAEPTSGGRTVYRILQHLGEAHASYLRTTVGVVDNLPVAVRAIEQGSDDLPAALNILWNIANRRTAALSEVERTRVVQHGPMPWSARRALRRMLEHQWEHLQEVLNRL